MFGQATIRRNSKSVEWTMQLKLQVQFDGSTFIAIIFLGCTYKDIYGNNVPREHFIGAFMVTISPGGHM